MSDAIPSTTSPSFVYRATVLRVVDGDTIDLMVDLGFDAHTKQRIRLAEVFAAESNTPEGKLHSAHLSSLLVPGHIVVLESQRVDKAVRDKYGRFVGVIYHHGEAINPVQQGFIGAPQGLGVRIIKGVAN